MRQNLVAVWRSDGRWLYDCKRCHTTDSRGDWRETMKLANRHAKIHINVGFVFNRLETNG